MKCLYCNQNFAYSLSLREIFSLSFHLPNQLCTKCQNLFLPSNEKDSCPRCRKPGESILCQDCQRWQKKYPNYDFHHHALFQYNPAMHDWFSLYKFKGHRQLAGCFASELQQKMNIFSRKMLIPIPLSKERLKQRGFNQVEELLIQAGIDYQPILKKKKTADQQAQSSKTRKERLQTNQPFYLPKKFHSVCSGKDLVLIDDIYTTGQTLFHAANCFRTLNVKKIETFSLAR